jgi:peroxiredoxin
MTSRFASLLVGALLLGSVGCATSPPKPSAPATPAAPGSRPEAEPAASEAPAAASGTTLAQLLVGNPSVTSWDGKPLALKSLSGPVTVLFLWSADCKSCARKLSQLQALRQRQGTSADVRIVAVNTDSSVKLAAAKDLAASLSLSIPLVRDDGHQVRCRLRQIFGAEFFPHATEASPRVDVVPLPLLAIVGPGDKVWGEVPNNESESEASFVAAKQLLLEQAQRGQLPERKPAMHVRGEANLDNGLQLFFPAMSDEQIDAELPKVEEQILQAYPRLPRSQRERMLHQAVDAMRRGGRVLLVP